MTTDTPGAAPAARTPAIVLIHGLWLTPLSWEGWKQRFESKGQAVLAPAWPGLEGTVEDHRFVGLWPSPAVPVASSSRSQVAVRAASAATRLACGKPSVEAD